MVIGREEPRRGPASSRQRHRRAVLLKLNAAEHRGKGREGKNIVGKINFPICIVAKELEEVGQQRQSGVLRDWPRGAKGRRGVKAVIHLGHLDRRSPKTQFVISGRHGLTHREVHGKRRGHSPEQQCAGRQQFAEIRTFAAAREQCPDTKAHKGKIEHHHAGKKPVPHTGRREPCRRTAQCREGGKSRMKSAPQGQKRTEQKQHRQSGQHTEQFHRQSLLSFISLYHVIFS